MKNEEWLVSRQHSSSSALPSVRAAILHSSFFILNRNENISFKLWKLIY